MRKDFKKSKTNDDGAAQTNPPVYRLTAREEEALNRQIRRSEAEPPAPRLRITNSGKPQELLLDHPDVGIGARLLAEAVGSANEDFLKGFLHQLASATSAGDNEQNLNFALSVVTNIKPNDQLEAMLASHIAVTHMLAMTSARRLALAESLEERDSAERAFNKLTRTLTTQIEALKRYRTGVEQRVTVQNVSVNDGGQAIVGDVVQARRHRDRQQPVNATRSSTDVRRPAMPLVGEVIPLKRAPNE